MRRRSLLRGTSGEGGAGTGNVSSNALPAQWSPRNLGASGGHSAQRTKGWPSALDDQPLVHHRGGDQMGRSDGEIRRGFLKVPACGETA